MKPIVILENIRSAYNVGNIIRTADALGYEVILAWFSPSPEDNESVKKTSLGAEENVNIQQYWHVQEALDSVINKWYKIVAAEIIEGKSIDLWTVLTDKNRRNALSKHPLAIVMWNENEWVMEVTLDQVDHIIHIPMEWLKESLNVGQAAAILMWELKKLA